MLLVLVVGAGEDVGAAVGAGAAVAVGAALGAADGLAVTAGPLGSGAGAFGNAPPPPEEAEPPPPQAASAGRQSRNAKRVNAVMREVLKDFITLYVFGVDRRALKLPAGQPKERRVQKRGTQVIIGKALGCFISDGCSRGTIC